MFLMLQMPLFLIIAIIVINELAKKLTKSDTYGLFRTMLFTKLLIMDLK